LEIQGGKIEEMTFRKRKGVSPVIATVILVAVAITVAVGVSYWMGGISAQYTQFEKIEIQTGFSTKDATNGWTVELSLKNSGSAASTITHLFINDVPVVLATPGAEPSCFDGTADGGIYTDLNTDGLTIDSGASDTIYIWIEVGGTQVLTSGTTINVKLHSAGGMDYIKLIRLV
jgi:flagellin-like protein